MKKNSFFYRIFILLLATVVLFAVLTMLIFTFLSSDIFTKMKVWELEPRAEAIAHLVLKYHQGLMSKSEVEEQLSIYNAFWDAVVYIYDSQGKLIFINEGSFISQLQPQSHLKMNQILTEVFGEYLEPVLSGEKVVTSRGNSRGPNLFLMVGQPVINDGIITGAVFLTKPLTEFFTALRGFNRAMMLSALGVFLLISIPMYRVVRLLVKPLKEMQDVAISMANGNLSAKANENYKGEIGELGRSLNYLSSELSKTISALEVERNRLKQIFNGLAEGIVALDALGNITYVNPAIHTLFGVNREDGRMGLIPSPELWEDFDTLLSQGHVITRSMQWKQMVLRITIYPLENELQQIVGAVGLFRDVTESERLEQTRREYVANVSHEFQTPVSALRALAETLLDDMVPDEETKKRYYRHMLHETIRLSRLINDLLMLSRLQSGAVSTQREAFQINELMENVADRYTVLAAEKNIVFSFSPLPGDSTIISNADLVEEVLIILLDNAIKYTLPNGSISLFACLDEHDDQIVKVSVADTGIGISPDDLPHIFERFYKADKAHATQGTGLGLAIAFEILQHLGEKIYVESQEGKGSTFTFTLTRQPADA